MSGSAGADGAGGGGAALTAKPLVPAKNARAVSPPPLPPELLLLLLLFTFEFESNSEGPARASGEPTNVFGVCCRVSCGVKPFVVVGAAGLELKAAVVLLPPPTSVRVGVPICASNAIRTEVRS